MTIDGGAISTRMSVFGAGRRGPMVARAAGLAFAAALLGPVPMALAQSDEQRASDTQPDENNDRDLQQADQPARGEDRRGEPARGVNALGAQPGLNVIRPVDVPPVEPGAETVSFDSFSEAVELAAIVDYISRAMGVNIVVRGQLQGQVAFNAPIEVPKSELLNLLDTILSQFNFTIAEEANGIYVIQQGGGGPNPEGELQTLRIVRTPNVKPSALRELIEPRRQGVEVTYSDAIGAVVMTGPANRLRQLEEFIGVILSTYGELKLFRLDLKHISAPTARSRATGLAGAAATIAQRLGQQQGGDNQGGAVAIAGASLENLSDRLGIDPQGNALLFLGRDDEVGRVRALIAQIDVPSELLPRKYEVGTAARQVADIARQRGLGEVTTIDTASSASGGLGFDGGFQGQQGLGGLLNQATGASGVGGPTMVVDVSKGSIIYYGTDAQQQQLAALIETLDPAGDVNVIRVYRLSNAKADELAETLQAVVLGQSRTGQSDFLGGAGGATQQNIPRQIQNILGGAGDDISADFDPDQVQIEADLPTNQVIVRAPVRQQPSIARLIEALDANRPQVYIEATIISVSDSDDLRFAVDAFGDFGDVVLESDFALREQSGFGDPGNPVNGLQGLTLALLPNDSLPAVITAVKNETDARIVARPQLLVNDNEEATVESLEQQATTETSQGETTTNISFSGFQDAGTTLIITPSISDDGFIRLDFEISQSNFLGPSTNGIPSDRSEQSVISSVTLPSNTTIIVGGIRTTNNTKSRDKLPILGSIPVIGYLFSDTTTEKSESVLYVFITPKIMTDPDFLDLRLISEGPQKEVKLERDLPPLEPRRIGVVGLPEIR